MIDRLRAAIEERLKLAKAATPGPWVVKANYPQGIVSPAFLDGPDSVGDAETWLISTTLTDRPEADAAHIAANDPAFVIRACERDLKVLERHEPVEVWAGWEHLPETDPGHHRVVAVVCGWCIEDQDPEERYDCRHGARSWPCDEVRDLAAVYGIEVTE